MSPEICSGLLTHHQGGHSLITVPNPLTPNKSLLFQLTMWCPILALVSIALLYVKISVSQLNNYNEKTVFSFIDTVAKRNVSQVCGDSLLKVCIQFSSYEKTH